MALARAQSVPNVRAKVKNLTKQVSRALIRQDSEILLPEEKLSINESRIDEGEFSWTVKVKSANGEMKLERVLVVGPKGCRLYLPKSLQELDDIPYTKMKEFSYNAQHHVFQISWQPHNPDNIEKIYFHTKNCVEIHEAIQKFIKDILREKSKSKNPDDVLARCTYIRRANLSELKKGGRITTSSEESSPLPNRRVPDRTTSAQQSRTQSRKKEISDKWTPKKITDSNGKSNGKEKMENLEAPEDDEGEAEYTKSSPTPKKRQEDVKSNSDSESSSEYNKMSRSAPHTLKSKSLHSPTKGDKFIATSPKKSRSPQKEKPKLIDIGEESSGSN